MKGYVSEGVRESFNIPSSPTHKDRQQDPGIPLCNAEAGEINVVLWRRGEVQQLSKLSLECCLVEELEKVHVVRLGAEVALQELVDRRLNQKRVVDGNEPNAVLLVPARLTPAGDGAVHDVICDEEEGLQLQARCWQTTRAQGRVFVSVCECG